MSVEEQEGKVSISVSKRLMRHRLKDVNLSLLRRRGWRLVCVCEQVLDTLMQWLPIEQIDSTSSRMKASEHLVNKVK